MLRHYDVARIAICRKVHLPLPPSVARVINPLSRRTHIHASSRVLNRDSVSFFWIVLLCIFPVFRGRGEENASERERERWHLQTRNARYRERVRWRRNNALTLLNNSTHYIPPHRTPLLRIVCAIVVIRLLFAAARRRKKKRKNQIINKDTHIEVRVRLGISIFPQLRERVASERARDTRKCRPQGRRVNLHSSQ